MKTETEEMEVIVETFNQDGLCSGILGADDRKHALIKLKIVIVQYIVQMYFQW